MRQVPQAERCVFSNASSRTRFFGPGRMEQFSWNGSSRADPSGVPVARAHRSDRWRRAGIPRGGDATSGEATGGDAKECRARMSSLAFRRWISVMRRGSGGVRRSFAASPSPCALGLRSRYDLDLRMASVARLRRKLVSPTPSGTARASSQFELWTNRFRYDSNRNAAIPHPSPTPRRNRRCVWCFLGALERRLLREQSFATPRQPL